MRGYPEDIEKEKVIQPKEVIAPVVEPVAQPKEVVRYVYAPVPQYYPTQRIQLDPNIALIVLGVVTVVGVVAIMFLSKK